MTILEKLQKMSIEERKKYFNHMHIVDDTLYQDKHIFLDIDTVACNPRICKQFTGEGCNFENPTNKICFHCTNLWLRSEVVKWI